MKQTYLLLFLLSIISACDSSNDKKSDNSWTPKKFDSTIVAYSQLVISSTLQWTEFIKLEKQQDAIKARERVAYISDSILHNLESLEDVGGSENYRLAAIKMLLHQKKYYSNEFKAFDILDSTSSIKLRDSIIDNVLRPSAKEERIIGQHLDSMRAKYCLKNNIEYID